MKKTILIGSVAALVVAGAAVAQTARHEGHRGLNADADGDGRVSQAEFVSARARAFAAMDADGDGLVGAEEARAAHAARRAEAMSARFDRLDANSDGVISRDEFTAGRQGGHGGRGRHGMGGRHGADAAEPRSLADVEARAAARFARMDADGDGYVTEADRRARMDARRGHRRGAGAPAE